MSASALLGLQWGDEGKGKMVDLLAEDADFVVRCQGGSNAGHTVYVGDEKLVLHLVPSGILNPRSVCVVGNGVVLDPKQLLEELASLEARGIELAGRLFVSDRAHVVFPYHRALDGAQENARGSAKIGTTGRGIGPTYEDKVARSGIRCMDLLDTDSLRDRIATALEEKQNRLKGTELGALEETFELYRSYGEQLRPYITDTVSLLLKAQREGKHLFLEGAQGSLLDLDLGTYPFVTSSNAQIGGLLAGCGLPARALGEVIGVIKAYSTRVGEGPYPTELHDDVGQHLRDQGDEYGSTTGRPRRCGWFDGVAARFAVETNGVDSLVLTKADVLSGLKELKICTSYRWRGQETDDFPSTGLDASEPIYRSMPGWSEDIQGVANFEDLPENLKGFVVAIEEISGAPVKWISVGPGRNDIIRRSS